ncbi:MAG TPA: hypothetical protein VM925_27060 [Labilithrix sp.]|nr:hypothetical protein [Labilithrix sp.]
MCAALLTLAGSAEAEPTLTERLRLQGGYFTEARPAPQPRIDSLYVAAIPELALFWARPSSLVSVTYQLTGALNSLGGASELANRLVVASLWELSARTTLLLSAEAAQTSFSNLLIARPAAASNVALFPSVANRVLTTRVVQGINHELTPRLRLEQGADAGYLTSIAPSPPIETFLANVNVGLERIWRNDGVGVELRAGYVNTKVPPPAPTQEFITLTGAPRWRHDWTNSLSTTVSAGASVVFATTGNTDPLLAPFGRASALYLWEDTTFGLNYSVGVAASPLTGQVIRSDQVTANVFTPISQHERVFLGASAGFLRASVVDLVNRANSQDFDALLTDVDLTWQASGLVGVFARYQFIAQLGEVNVAGVNPSFLRDFFLVGVQLSSRPAGGDLVPTRFPQRVDGGDTRISGGAGGGGSTLGGPAGRWVTTTPARPPAQ